MSENGSLPKIGDGDVPITIGNKQYVLKPTWAATQAISRQGGGIMGAVDAVLKLNVDVLMQVIMLGLGYHGQRRPPKDLEEAIWKEGFSDESGAIVERAVTYLRVLANGGRMPASPQEDQPEGYGLPDDDRPTVS